MASLRGAAPGGRRPQRFSTGVEGLDEMIGGGYLAGDSTLIAGSPGTGKTTLGLQFIAAGARVGEPGVFVTFEYLPRQIYRDAEAKGFPLKRWEEEGLVRVVCTTPEILLARDPGGTTVLDDAVNGIKAKRLVIDSLVQFTAMTDQGGDLRGKLAGLMNHLRMLGVTTVATHEIAEIVGPTVRISDHGFEFLADNVIMLRYVELEGEMRIGINILKFRGGAHDRQYKLMTLTDRGAVVELGFKGVENITAGTARRTVRDRAEALV